MFIADFKKSKAQLVYSYHSMSLVLLTFWPYTTRQSKKRVRSCIVLTLICKGHKFNAFVTVLERNGRFADFRLVTTAIHIVKLEHS